MYYIIKKYKYIIIMFDNIYGFINYISEKIDEITIDIIQGLDFLFEE